MTRLSDDTLYSVIQHIIIFVILFALVLFAWAPVIAVLLVMSHITHEPIPLWAWGMSIGLAIGINISFFIRLRRAPHDEIKTT